MAEADTTSDTMPVPRRFWWLKRIVAMVVLLTGVMVGLRYWALAKAQREFVQFIESIRQGGDPVYAQDFASAISAGDGGEKLLEAARRFAISKQVVPAWDRLPRSAFRNSEKAMIDRVLAANHQQLKLVREARSQPVDFPAYDVTWGTTHGVPMLNEFMHLADALSKAGHRSHQNDDDGEAVEYLQDQLSVERLLEHYPYQAAHMIAESISAPSI